jgi:hypothetical protein
MRNYGEEWGNRLKRTAGLYGLLLLMGMGSLLFLKLARPQSYEAANAFDLLTLPLFPLAIWLVGGCGYTAFPFSVKIHLEELPYLCVFSFHLIAYFGLVLVDVAFLNKVKHYSLKVAMALLSSMIVLVVFSLVRGVFVNP